MISANDVKTKGISCFEQSLSQQPEVMITVRGKERYVVMKVDHYHYLREMELEAALFETQRDLSNGNTSNKSITEHVNEVFD